MLDNTINNSLKNIPEQLIFGLDIGTRSLVGSVGYMEHNNFKVIAHCIKEHETRAMLDGQIHDINAVGESIAFVKRELENQIGRTLKEVCIAAAGRVLKTISVNVSDEFEQEQHITTEDIYSLEHLGVEKAYELIREKEKDVKYFCVGHSVIKYYLNDYMILNLEGHRAKKISADILATFLPNEVVEDLYTAVNIADLEVANLTLEPIAAINIAIPEKFRLLNIALVDVGAGTSDISITKEGSIIAYGMIPHAGDEITESLLNDCLVEFNVAEQIKLKSCEMDVKDITFTDILGLPQTKDVEVIRDLYKESVISITKDISNKIKELNGNKTVNAVFVVGGGGKAYNFIENLAIFLELPKERVALRGEEVLKEVEFIDKTIKKDPLLVTPIGICLSYYTHRNNFVYVNINGERVKLYDNNKLTVLDAALMINFPNYELFPRRGKELIIKVNNKERMIKGEFGEPAVITINDEIASINSKIKKNDRIIIKSSSIGKDGSMTIADFKEIKEDMQINLNGKLVTCKRVLTVNGKLQTPNYQIKNNDSIELRDYYTVKQLCELIDVDLNIFDIFVNNQKSKLDDKVYENFTVEVKEKDYTSINDLQSDEKDSIKDESFTTNSDSIKNTELRDNIESKSQDIINTNASLESIGVIINNTPCTLTGKTSYIFVDILDFYPFNTKVAGGTSLIIQRNGENCNFSDLIFNGDILSIYWKD